MTLVIESNNGIATIFGVLIFNTPASTTMRNTPTIIVDQGKVDFRKASACSGVENICTVLLRNPIRLAESITQGMMKLLENWEIASM